jgi:NADH-quinone oxidoreductase subunit E
VTKEKILSPQTAAQLGDIDCILVLGCHVRSQYLADRLTTAFGLYDMGASPKLLMTGDHGREAYDEVNYMLDKAEEHGIERKDVFTDHAGFSTYESIYRAKEIFGAERIIIVTQEYHLYRSLYLAEKLGMSEARIYSIATFYENFSLEPKGKYVIKICDGTACHVRKSIPILERLRQELGLSESKKTTDDLCFTLETVSCLGACGLAPVLTVNDVVYPEMTPDKATALLKQLKEEMENA